MIVIVIIINQKYLRLQSHPKRGLALGSLKLGNPHLGNPHLGNPQPATQLLHADAASQPNSCRRSAAVKSSQVKWLLSLERKKRKKRKNRKEKKEKERKKRKNRKKEKKKKERSTVPKRGC